MRKVHREQAEMNNEWNKLADQAGIAEGIKDEFHQLLMTDENFGKGFEAF